MEVDRDDPLWTYDGHWYLKGWLRGRPGFDPHILSKRQNNMSTRLAKVFWDQECQTIGFEQNRRRCWTTLSDASGNSRKRKVGDWDRDIADFAIGRLVEDSDDEVEAELSHHTRPHELDSRGTREMAADTDTFVEAEGADAGPIDATGVVERLRNERVQFWVEVSFQQDLRCLRRILQRLDCLLSDHATEGQLPPKCLSAISGTNQRISFVETWLDETFGALGQCFRLKLDGYEDLMPLLRPLRSVLERTIASKLNGLVLVRRVGERLDQLTDLLNEMPHLPSLPPETVLSARFVYQALFRLSRMRERVRAYRETLQRGLATDGRTVEQANFRDMPVGRHASGASTALRQAYPPSRDTTSQSSIGSKGSTSPSAVKALGSPHSLGRRHPFRQMQGGSHERVASNTLRTFMLQSTRGSDVGRARSATLGSTHTDPGTASHVRQTSVSTRFRIAEPRPRC